MSEYPTYQDYADEQDPDFCETCTKFSGCDHKGHGKCNDYEECP